MKKLLISICAIFCFIAAPVASVEWGGLFFNDTGASATDFSGVTINQSNGISIWVKAPVGETGLAFSTEALYKFNLEVTKGVDPILTHIVDVPLFKVAGDINAGSGVLSLNAGRFYYVDGSTAVLSQVVDGASITYGLPTIKFGGFVGYTGLVNALNVPMSVAPEKDTKFYNLAYPYLPIGAFIEFPAMGGNQSLEIDAYYLLDLGSAKTNLCYANLVLSGPISNSVYYNIATCLGLMDFKNVMNYSSASLLVFPSESLSLNAGATFGSADQGSLTSFISPATTSILAAGKITPKAGLTFTTESMCFDFGGNFVLTYDGSKYAPATTDWNAGFIYNIFSDLQVGLSVNASFDVTGANAHNYNAKLNLSLAF